MSALAQESTLLESAELELFLGISRQLNEQRNGFRACLNEN